MISDDGYGTATVNGKPVSKGKCVKFDFSPLPIYLLPVGEAARDFDKTYTVKFLGNIVGGAVIALVMWFCFGRNKEQA